MNEILNPVQNISYTSKDFQTIFPELLDLVKQLTSRWDPSISNESDPGVVLLKLSAILADKLNYNIDKNVLECFPLSVTQLPNARQLYEQLGYKMSWYKSAYTNVSIKWDSDVSDGYVTIPPFTMVSDAENSVVYTLIGSPVGVDDNTFAVGSQDLYFNGDTIQFKAIQGIAIKYDINGETTIKVNHLDKNNRIYFNSYNVAQNGVFITNVGSNNYVDWQRKDNLLVESAGNTYYSFGLSDDGTTCYIEFPEDAENVIKDGINITYIRSSGHEGNVAANVIDKFYTDVYLTNSLGNTVVLNDDTTVVTNPASAANGENPETLASAYKNFKRTAGTFNTLVTLRDYLNYVLRSGLVSNCFICDKTNDVQCVYSILTLDNDVETTKTAIENIFETETVTYIDPDDGETTGEVQVLRSALTPYDLKLYLLERVSDISDVYDYNKTFNLLSNSAQEVVKYYVEDAKCISHTWADILPATSSSPHVCYFKNVYPLNCKVITKYSLTRAQSQEVEENIKKALFENLNSSNVEFGDSISLDYVNQILTNADERIKNVIVDNIEYKTYAVIYDGSRFKEVYISDNSDAFTTEINYSAPDYDSTSGYVEDSLCMYKGTRYKANTGISSPAGTFDASKWDEDELVVNLNSGTFFGKVGYNDYSSYMFKYVSGSGWKLNGTESDTLSTYGGSIVSGTSSPNDIITISRSVSELIRNDVRAKSILAGISPLFESTGKFDYTFNQLITAIKEDVYRVHSNTTISVTNSVPQYTLKANESLQFYAPNFINGSTYSNYVKFEYVIGSDIPANADYQLKQNEYIIFYWKSDEDDSELYNYYVYAEGNIFKPTFAMAAQTGAVIGSSLAASSRLRNIGTTTNPAYVADSNYNGPMDIAISMQVASIVAKSNILSGTKSVTIRKINRITFNNTYYCYWILNDAVDGHYIIFENDPTAPDQEYILNNGEYFFYSNGALSELGILGSGTKISRHCDTGCSGSWVVSAGANIFNILSNGTAALANYWVQPFIGQVTQATENQFITLGPETTVKFTKTDGSTPWGLTFTSAGVSGDTLSNYSIQYKNPNEDVWNDISSISMNSSSAGWDGRSLLALNISKTIQQRLYSNQSITLEYTDGTSPFVITGADPTVDIGDSNLPYYPVVLKSEFDVSYDGGGKHSVFSIDTYGQVQYDSIYIYREDLTTYDRTIRVNTAGDLIFVFPPSASSTNTLTTKFKLPAGTYMARLINSSLEISDPSEDTLSVTIGTNTAVPLIYDNTVTNFAGNNNIILDFNVATETETNLTITVSAHSSEVIITLENPMMYQQYSGLSAVEYNSLLAKIIQLDKDKLYNYMHIPSSDQIIPDPIVPATFLLSNHIDNNYTLCQLDALNSNIQVLGVR